MTAEAVAPAEIAPHQEADPRPAEAANLHGRYREIHAFHLITGGESVRSTAEKSIQELIFLLRTGHRLKLQLAEQLFFPVI